MVEEKSPLLIAFYLPQFHPIPENDTAWGAGFTEWNNVVKTKPKFRGHQQPHLPKDLGFYDLRLDETRAQQAKMAVNYGIDAFCYYNYWLNGRSILGTPLELEMNAPDRDLPICLCWANHNWTKAWDGREADIILQQEYTLESLKNYCAYLMPYFMRSRYLKLDGRPIFLVYSPEEIPVEIDFPKILRSEAKEKGIQDIHMVAVKNWRAKLTSNDYIKNGYNDVLLFQPNVDDFPRPTSINANLKFAVRKLIPQGIFNKFRMKINSYQKISYSGLVDNARNRPLGDSEIPCVFPSWDNSPRRSISTVIQNENAELFGAWLRAEIIKTNAVENKLNAVFINAWNEWAEGCYLEPDQANGAAFLEEVRRAKKATY